MEATERNNSFLLAFNFSSFLLPLYLSLSLTPQSPSVMFYSYGRRSTERWVATQEYVNWVNNKREKKSQQMFTDDSNHNKKIVASSHKFHIQFILNRYMRERELKVLFKLLVSLFLTSVTMKLKLLIGKSIIIVDKRAPQLNSSRRHCRFS